MIPFYLWLTLSSFLSRVANLALPSTVCNGLTTPTSLAWLRHCADQAAEGCSSRHSYLGPAWVVDYLTLAQPGQFGAFFSNLSGHLGICFPSTCSTGGIHLVVPLNKFVTTGGRHVTPSLRFWRQPAEQFFWRSHLLELLSFLPWRARLVLGHVMGPHSILLTAQFSFQ